MRAEEFEESIEEGLTGLVAGIIIGVLIGMILSETHYQNKAVEYDCGRYNFTENTFEWRK